ncbi:hypothetical protein [uncultured Psychroserpens sp.]|uniref:hypothetical protein n=1 Tax=uncultured Psychroserpens sp. TaxID=255436 RepID=UPI00261AE55D|nr:hypothetical protein [uncultured Psychroserpens sp.]
MTNHSNTKPPVWFWIISVIALIWNAMGVMQYLAQAYSTDSFKEQYTAEQLEMISNAPAWATAAFALAVFGGLLGSLFLLLRKKTAYIFFLISLVAVIVQLYHNFVVVDSMEIMGSIAAVMSGIIVGAAILLLWYSKYAIKKGWIK